MDDSGSGPIVRTCATRIGGFPPGRARSSVRGASGRARTDGQLRSALSRLWLAPRQAWGFEKITRAITAGECRSDVDPAAALGILYGPLYIPLLFDRDVPPAAQVEAHLAIALLPFS